MDGEDDITPNLTHNSKKSGNSSNNDNNNGTEKQTLFVAIDFGTTRSALFISMIEGIDEEANEEKYQKTRLFGWSKVPKNFSSHKGPTAILYDNKEPLSIGYSALSKYVTMSAQKKPNIKLYRRFKLKLGEDIDGIPTVDIVAAYLKQLKNRAVKHFKTKTEGKLKFENYNICWCITVPAMWKDDQKNFMIQAAERAGLTTSPNPIAKRELVIVLEPEAAATTFRSHMTDIGVDTNEKSLMVIDGGGGTIDITIHTVHGDKLEEILPGEGNSTGGDAINREYERLLNIYFDIPRFKSDYPESFFQLENEFESLKITRKTFKDRYIDFPIPKEILTYKRSSAADTKIPPSDDEYDEDNLCYFRLTAQEFQALWHPVLDGVKKLTADLIHECSERGIKIDYVYLVGGLSSSQIFQNCINDIFSNSGFHKNTKIVVPADPETAVVRGALKFGSEDKIFKRSARFTYGIAVSVPWDEAAHKPRGFNKVSQHDHNGQVKYFAPTKFFPMVTRGQQVLPDFPYSRDYPAFSPDDESVLIQIYCTKNKNIPEYVTDVGVAHLGDLVVNIDDLKGSNRKVTVELFFGRSTFEACAYPKGFPQKKLKQTYTAHYAATTNNDNNSTNNNGIPTTTTTTSPVSTTTTTTTTHNT